LVDLAPQYLELVRNNPNTVAAAVMLSAVHAIGTQQGFEISGYQLLLDYLRTLGVAPLAADAISSIMQGVAGVVSSVFPEYRRRGEDAIRRAATDELREIIGRTLAVPRPALPFRPIQVRLVMADPYVPPPPKATARRLALEDIQREPPPPSSPQRRGREGEIPEAKAPKAKQRMITEQEIMAEAKQKVVPAKFQPSAQPYIAPPLTSKAKPKGAPRLEDRTQFVITPKLTASEAPQNIDSIERLAKNEEDVAKLNAELSNPSITKNEESRIQFSIRDKNQKANIRSDSIKTGALIIRKDETVRTMYDRAVGTLEGIKNDKVELRMLIEGRKGATASIEKSKTHSSDEQRIAQKSNEIKEKEAALVSLEDDLMEINRRVQSTSSAAAASTGAGRFTTKAAKARAKPKAKSRATKTYIVYVQQPLIQPMT